MKKINMREFQFDILIKKNIKNNIQGFNHFILDKLFIVITFDRNVIKNFFLFYKRDYKKFYGIKFIQKIFLTQKLNFKNS